MPRLNLPLAFAELLAGAVILDAGIKGASVADVIKGQAKQSQLAGTGTSGAAGQSSGTPTGPGGAVNPFSGNGNPSRLDMGFDGTSSQFKAPFSGKIVASDQSNAGWQGGGYVAIKADQAIQGLDSDVVYFAEGLAPTVQVGQHVNAGDQIATPRANPYNGIVGNYEWGLASPNSPEQPLAHVVSDPVAMVMRFYKWARSLGVGPATSTGNAGYP